MSKTIENKVINKVVHNPAYDECMCGHVRDQHGSAGCHGLVQSHGGDEPCQCLDFEPADENITYA